MEVRPRIGSTTAGWASLELGPDGLFKLSLEPGDFTLSVRAEGYGTEERRITVEEGGHSDVVIALSKGARISGRALDGGGRGVANVSVTAVPDSPDLMAVPGRLRFGRTLPDGSFVLTDLAPGRYNILAGSGALGFALFSSIPTGSTEVALVLSPGGNVVILVVDSEGTPVPNAIVAVAGIDGRKVRGIQGTADENGRLELPAPRGNLSIKATPGNGPEALATVALVGAETARLEIVLVQPAGNLSRE